MACQRVCCARGRTAQLHVAQVREGGLEARAGGEARGAHGGVDLDVRAHRRHARRDARADETRAARVQVVRLLRERRLRVRRHGQCLRKVAARGVHVRCACGGRERERRTRA